MPKTTTRVTAALASEVLRANADPSSVPTNSAAVTFWLNNAEFSKNHMRTSGLRSTSALPSPALSILTPIIIYDLVHRAHSTTGVLLRDAAHEALMLFPTLVLGPKRPGASSTSVKNEVKAKLDL
jgi:hypothetical protein